MSDKNVTRFPDGVNASAEDSPFGDLPFPTPTAFHTYFNDFDTYNASDWTITTTEAGAGSATEALTDADGGVLLVTNAAGDNDLDFFNKVGESFLFESGKKMFFEAKLAVNLAAQNDVVVGLQITDTTALAVTDGVYFLNSDGAATVDFIVMKNSTGTTTSAVATMVDATMITLGFYYDGVSKIYYTVDGVVKGSSVTTNMPDDEELTISFGIQNGAAVVGTLSVDYIFVAKER